MLLDNTNKRILEILQNDGRITNRELAKKINMSPPPTLERVKKLEEKEYIQKYVALIDPEKVNAKCFTYVEVTLVRHGKKPVQRFMESITKMEEVLECHHITGDTDFLLKVVNKSVSDYENFMLHKLTELEDIQHLKTLVVLSTLKQETKIPINEG
ncbi:MAG: Lrp/AsnC family transcriptional regulator [Candidatus Marinimicrobia bacterium]|nr:Lrp/AsnC family transcriptional regulator [Candidatus Neomarinimicrobiota bacterium]